jgi:MFS family permease
MGDCGIGAIVAGVYRSLFSEPGSRAFFAAGFVGRMSMAMIGIGIILLISDVTGSYGFAGAVAAAFAITSAAATPFAGRLTDRHGQHPVLLVMSAGNAVGMTALIACAQLDAPTWTLFPAAAVLGLASPSLAGMVRARWSHFVDTPGRLQTAYSLETVADETIFVTGPIIVTAAATVVHPAAGLATAGVLAVTGCFALATQRRTEPVPHPRGDGGAGGTLIGPGMLVLITVFLLLGFVFTTVDVTAVAFADSAGHRWATGPLLSLFAFGSMVAGLWYGARRWHAPLHRRFCIGLMLLAAGMIPVALVRSLPLMMVAIFFAGLAISPTVIPGFGLIDRLVPRDRLTEGLSWAGTSIRTGITVGAPTAGWIIDEYGAGVAFLVPFVAAALAAIVGGTWSGTLRAPRESPAAVEPTA